LTEAFLAFGRFLYEFTLTYGVIGLACGAYLESLGIPTAAAVIDLTAGLLIINERTTFLKAVIVSDFGLVMGSLTSFYLGRAGSSLARRIRRDETDVQERYSAAQDWLDKYGDKAVLFGQLLGPARTWISYPAGAMGMDVKKFTLYTALGGTVYCTVAITASLFLTDFIRSRWDLIEHSALTPLLLVLVLAPTALLLWRWKKLRGLRAGRSAAGE
jgi:membrane protein DedA with SNARE-associated domain